MREPLIRGTVWSSLVMASILLVFFGSGCVPAAPDQRNGEGTGAEPTKARDLNPPVPETTRTGKTMPPPSPESGPTTDPPPASSDTSDTPAAPDTADHQEQLAALSDAFRGVARQVKPSVVQVASEVRLGSGQQRLSSQVSPGQLDELVQRFGPFLELDPELREYFRGRRFEQPGPDYQQYNVPLPIGNASGWIYDDQGHVVTNHHVVAQADQIRLTFYDDNQAEATLVGSDPQTDIAVLKTERTGLSPAPLSNQPVEQGDIVLAVGSPFRYAFSLSQGIVSATGRRMGILGPQGYENFIQTDAAINPGNSGGPLINTRGELVGMNTAIASRSGAFAGIGFAIPVEMIRDVAAELIRKGRVERGYLGVLTSDDRQLLDSFGVDRGALIEDLVDGGPAARAELQPGDVIVELEGKTLGGATELRRRIAETDPGQRIRMTIVRDGQRKTVDVTLEQQPAEQLAVASSGRPPAAKPHDASEASALAKLGFERLQTFTQDIARQNQLEFVAGVLVLDVRQFSAAAVSGLRRGHVITQLNGRKIADVEQLRSALEEKDLSQGVRIRIHVPGGPSRYALLSLAG